MSKIETIFETLKIAVPVVIFISSLIYGNKLSARWALKQKRKELHYKANEELYKIYGEFFALWKKWNFFLKNRKEEQREIIELFHKEACEIEGKSESLILRICTQFDFDEDMINDLGLLRQAFQSFRENIRYDCKIPWGDSEHNHYIELKRLVIGLGTFISNHNLENPKLEQRKNFENIIRITDNENEIKWRELLNESELEEYNSCKDKKNNL